MKRLFFLVGLALAFKLFFGSGAAFAQTAYKIPFKFFIEGKSYAPGEYRLAQKEEGKITLQKEPGGEEILIPFIKKLPQPETPIEEPQLIFDMVGNFEPSYTEYITDYVLAEVWLTKKEGFLVITTERSEYNKIVKGAKAKK